MLPLANMRQRLGWLMCPVCKTQLTGRDRAFACVGCKREWPQTGEFANLFPTDLWKPDFNAWARRQSVMAASYCDLLRDPSHATRAYACDFESYVTRLAGYSGRVLDVGGANGLVRQFLARSVDYTSLDPSVEWLDESWGVLSGDYPCLSRPLQFVHGAAEYIPFADGFFDAVLAFWSLNHCADPSRSLDEIARVLRPRGRCLLALEDVEPRWADILDNSYVHHDSWTGGRLIWEKCKAALVGWPVQSDHLRIAESDVYRWTRGAFSAVSRAWHGSYLTLELVR